MDEDELIRAVCEWLQRTGALAPQTEFRFGPDLIQIVRGRSVVAVAQPSILAPAVYARKRRRGETEPL
jgi:hypothetical protein